MASGPDEEVIKNLLKMKVLREDRGADDLRVIRGPFRLWKNEGSLVG